MSYEETVEIREAIVGLGEQLDELVNEIDRVGCFLGGLLASLIEVHAIGLLQMAVTTTYPPEDWAKKIGAVRLQELIHRAQRIQEAEDKAAARQPNPKPRPAPRPPVPFGYNVPDGAGYGWLCGPCGARGLPEEAEPLDGPPENDGDLVTCVCCDGSSLELIPVAAGKLFAAARTPSEANPTSPEDDIERARR